MWAIFGVVLLTGAIAGAELPPLLRGRMKRETAVFAMLLSLAAALCILYVLDVPIPNPTMLIIAVFDPIVKTASRLFG